MKKKLISRNVIGGIIVLVVAIALLISRSNDKQENTDVVNVTGQPILKSPKLTQKTKPTPRPTLRLVEVKKTMKNVKLLQEHTVYHYSSYNRDNNLRVAAQMLNKTVVLPGEEFSFFSIIGNPNSEKGFKEAGVIINHKPATALAGGICEVATSLNTVIVNAGIKTNAQNHSLNVGYLNLTDHEATVTYDGGIDLKFTNTLKYPIMITQSVSGGNVTTRLFKVKVIRKVIFKNVENDKKSKESYVVKKMIAQNTSAQTKYDLKLNKFKYYYLNSNDFFEMSCPKVKGPKNILKSLRIAAVNAELEIDRTIGDKKLAVKNTKQFPILVQICYNTKGEAKVEILRLERN